MANHSSLKIRQRPWFDTAYRVGIGIKGVDGLVELVVGLALWISPHLVHAALIGLAGEFGDHHAHVFQLIARYIAGVDVELARGGVWFLVAFLVLHGIVKIALVYCLIKRITRAYPVALMILVVFLLYQLYVVIIQPTIGMMLFAVLDGVIIWLVWGEYRDLLERK